MEKYPLLVFASVGQCARRFFVFFLRECFQKLACLFFMLQSGLGWSWSHTWFWVLAAPLMQPCDLKVPSTLSFKCFHLSSGGVTELPSWVYWDGWFDPREMVAAQCLVHGRWPVKIDQPLSSSSSFSVKGQTVNILGFLGRTLLVTTSQLCPCSRKAARDDV